MTPIICPTYVVYDIYVGITWIYLPHFENIFCLIVNCQWGEWSDNPCIPTCSHLSSEEWDAHKCLSTDQKMCEIGYKTNNRSKTAERKYGGTECTGNSTKTEVCTLAFCNGRWK